VKATKVNAGLAESNGRLLLGIWRDSLHVTCGLTACTPGSAPGPTLGNEYGKTFFTLPTYTSLLFVCWLIQPGLATAKLCKQVCAKPEEDDDWVKKCTECEAEGPRLTGRPKRTWTEVVEKDCQARKLNKEDAVDHNR